MRTNISSAEQVESESPHSVSLVEGACSQPYNRMPIQSTEYHTGSNSEYFALRNMSHQIPLRNSSGHKPYSKFTVCVPPINNYFNDYHRFVEMVELNRLLGADRFVFYNHSIGRDLNTIIHNYIKRSKALFLIKSWRLPPNVMNITLRSHVHYFGQLVATNDCLYETKSTSQYTVFSDLDEFIIPKLPHTKWADMLSQN